MPVASRLPAYEELLVRGSSTGSSSSRATCRRCAAHLARLLDEPELRDELVATRPSAPSTLRWPRVADELEEVYAARRPAPRRPRRRARSGASSPRGTLIDVDLHMHTDHSYDCATPVEVLLAEARARGLGAIAVTDHNEISGAHEARGQGRRRSR